MKKKTKRKTRRVTQKMYCFSCESSNISSGNELKELRPNGDPMCEYICNDCELEWIE